MRKIREKSEEPVRDKVTRQSKKSKNNNKKKNANIFKVAYIFIGLFALMAGRFIYFMAVESPSQINSSYNKRQDLLA